MKSRQLAPLNYALFAVPYNRLPLLGKLPSRLFIWVLVKLESEAQLKALSEPRFKNKTFIQLRVID